MLFNVPLPGGTSVHPLGAGLAAALLGPWGALVSMSLALAVQALFFGDGGILALGVNCLAMAAIMTSISYAVYRLAAGNSANDSSRRAFASAIGAYAGMNCAALAVACILGIQPQLYHDAAGHALYFPFGLNVTIPAIMIPHLTVAGFAEAAFTFAAVRFLQRTGYQLAGQSIETKVHSIPPRLAWAGLGLCLLLAPAGLLAVGGAWGEWSVEEIEQQASYRPAQLDAAERNGWKGFQVFPDYLGDKGPAAYCFSALAGVGILSVAGTGLGRFGRRTKAKHREVIREVIVQPASPPSPVAPHAIPDWLTGNHTPPRDDYSARQEPFVERTLSGLSNAALLVLRSEDTAKRDGLWQRLDVRVRIASALALLVCACSLHSPLLIVVFYALIVTIGFASHLSLKSLLGRVWASAPLFMAGIAIPTMFDSVTPGRTVFSLCSDPHLAISAQGLVAAGALLVRTATCVTIGLLLISTSRRSDLFAGLRSLRLPKRALDSFALTFRHLTTLASAAADLFVARQARSVGKKSSSSGRRDTGNLVAGLFLKSETMAAEVDLAVEARTVSHTNRTQKRIKASVHDYLWIASLFLVLSILLWKDWHG
jgi:cobalt/nickel transport system permease protein